MNSPAARAVSKLAASPTVCASRVRPACMQSLSYHSTTAADSKQSSVRRVDTSSLRDPEVDPRNWGYRIVVPSSSTHRSYATSSIAPATITEDYDDYTLYGGPSESVHCDLGAIISGGDLDAILQFDDAGFVRPIWETVGGDASNAVQEDEWSLQSHNDNRSHETTEPSAAATDEPFEDAEML